MHAGWGVTSPAESRSASRSRHAASTTAAGAWRACAGGRYARPRRRKSLGQAMNHGRIEIPCRECAVVPP